jgi:hypothetical protein
MNFGQMLMLAEKLAEEASLPIEKYIKAAAVTEKYNLQQAEARQATEAEKEMIMQALQSLNGHISEDLPPSEIIASAGVRKIQGTMSYARYQIKQLLLEHKK